MTNIFLATQSTWSNRVSRILAIVWCALIFVGGCSNKDQPSVQSVDAASLYNINPDQFIDRFTTTVTRLAGKNAPMNWPKQPALLEEVSDHPVVVATYPLANGVKLSGVFDKPSQKLQSVVLIVDQVRNEDDIKGLTAYIWLVSSSFDPEMTQDAAAKFLDSLFLEATKNGGAPSKVLANGNSYTLSLSKENQVTFVMRKP